MIRQAHTYLVGALSGVVVIAIAIAAFVVLVSAQVFHDLPIPALSSSDQKTAVSSGKAVSSPDRQAVATTGGATPGTFQPNHVSANRAAAQTGATNPQPNGRHHATNATPTHDATAPAQVVETAPGTTSGNEGSSGGGNSGSHSSQPSSSSHSPTDSSSGNSGGGNGGSGGTSGTSGSGSGGGSGNSGSGTTGSSGNGSPTDTSGEGSTTTTTPPSTPVTTAKPSEVITETVNKTVGGVDEALGGTLSETGVTKVTEEVVGGAAGPESVVGKTVDGVGEVVGGLLGGKGE
jgi:hypothetical protein